MSQDKQPHSTHQADSIMLTLVLILAVLGLLILFSASEYNGRVRFHVLHTDLLQSHTAAFPHIAPCIFALPVP